MNKRDLASVLIRAIGVYIVASAIPNLVGVLAMSFIGSTVGRAVTTANEFWWRTLISELVQVVVGVALFYGGGSVAKLLLRVDESVDW